MTPSETAELRTFISGELQKVHSRFDGVDGKLGGLGARLEGVEEGLGGLRGEVGGLSTRLDGVEEGLDRLREDQARVEALAASQFAQIGSRLTKAETAREETHRDFGAFREELQSMDRKLDESRDEMRRGFREQGEQIRAGFAQWGERTKVLEGRVGALERTRGDVPE